MLIFTGFAAVVFCTSRRVHSKSTPSYQQVKRRGAVSQRQFNSKQHRVHSTFRARVSRHACYCTYITARVSVHAYRGTYITARILQPVTFGVPEIAISQPGLHNRGVDIHGSRGGVFLYVTASSQQVNTKLAASGTAGSSKSTAI